MKKPIKATAKSCKLRYHTTLRLALQRLRRTINKAQVLPPSCSSYISCSRYVGEGTGSVASSAAALMKARLQQQHPGIHNSSCQAHRAAVAAWSDVAMRNMAVGCAAAALDIAELQQQTPGSHSSSCQAKTAAVAAWSDVKMHGMAAAHSDCVAAARMYT
jgi:hypothetical protein